MSAGQPVPLEAARAVAAALRELLAPACARIEIAGSIRRRKATVGDLELVAIPRLVAEPAGDLWGTELRERNLLADRVAELIAAGELAPREVTITRADGSIEQARRMGRAYLALVFRELPVDLFIVHPPAEWGVIFALRTGPGDWNIRLVSECRRYLRRVASGQVLTAAGPIACPEEADFFRALGQPWVEPWERRPERVRIDPRLLAEAQGRERDGLDERDDRGRRESPALDARPR
jgi:DNA polymerase/3'-5' exonuclease PolX